MPLLDHFRPPLYPTRSWEGFHAVWVTSIADALTRLLPDGYFAEDMVHLGPSVEIDVATFGGRDGPPADPHPAPGPGGNGVAVAARPQAYVAPPAAATVPAVFADDYEIRVIGDRSGRHLVAAVELVSEGNKDRRDHRRAFAAKCASYLYHGVAVVIVDVVTVRSADLHRETLAAIGAGDVAPVPGGSALYAAAYRPIRRAGPRAEVDVWVEPLAVGAPLPTLPLWLNAAEAIPVELEATYQDACRRRRIAG